MIEDYIIDSFKKSYKNIHPLVFHRSLEKSKKSINLFDALQSVPKNGPYFWDDKNKVWKKDYDFLIYKEVKKIMN